MKGLDIVNQQNYAFTGSSNTTIDHVTVKGSPIVQNGGGTISNSIHSGAADVATTSGYTLTDVHAPFESYSLDYINESEQDRQDILTGLGDSSGGYLADVYNQLEADVIDAGDYLTYTDVIRNSFDSEDMTERVYYDMQYARMGLSTPGMDKSVTLNVANGSTVIPGSTGDEVQLSSSKEYSGHLWTMNPPSSGQWTTGNTYDTANLGGPVHLTYYTTEEQVVDGEVTVKTVAKTVSIKGDFTVSALYDASGNQVDSMNHTKSYDPADPYDPSDYRDAVTTSQENAENAEERANNNDGSGGGGSGPASGNCGIKLLDGSGFGFCTGITSMQIGIAALVVIGIPVLYLARPIFSILAGFVN